MAHEVHVVPTYHPSYIMRGLWPHLTTVIFDVEHKARRLVAGAVAIPDAECYVPPSGADAVVALESIANRPDIPVAVDVEGDVGSLLCVGFCQAPPVCVVVPTRRGWWDSEDEHLVRAALRMVLASPVPKVMHHMVYDLEVLEHEGWTVNNCIWDTMLLAHLCFPELPKRLDYWRSILTWVPPYKHLIREKDDK